MAVDEVTWPASCDAALFMADRPSAQGPIRITANFSAKPRPLPAGPALYHRIGGHQLGPYDVVVIQR